MRDKDDQLMATLEPGKARMTHPDPAVDDATVAAIQVPHMEHVGWRFVEGDREDWPEDAREESRQGWVYIRNRTTGGTAFVPELTPALRERAWEEVDPAAEQQADLEGKKVAELRELAKERGISPIPSTKDELLVALEQPQDQNQTEAGEQPAPPSEEE